MQKKRPAAISVDDDIPSSPVAKDADEAEGDDGENRGSSDVDSCDGEKLSSVEEEEWDFVRAERVGDEVVANPDRGLDGIHGALDAPKPSDFMVPESQLD